MRLRLEARSRLARLALELAPEDARVELDGRPIHAPAGAAVEIDPGDHVLVVTAPGHREHRAALTLAPGAQVERRVALEREEGGTAPPAAVPDERALLSPPPAAPATPLLEDPVLWAIVGSVVAVGIGVAIGVAVHLDSAPQPYGGTVGRVVEIP
jgi:hypothetical protein